ncbi:MAG: leucyl/phenylalanyl-tRNA--protein transferase [Planctomycetota bacterium]
MRREPPTPEDAAPRHEETDPLVAEALSWYRRGVFPMADLDRRIPGGPAEVYLYDPPERGIIPLEDGGLRVSKSLRQRVRSGRFRVSSDEAFGCVIAECGDPDREGAWIDPQVRAIYTHLHAAGVAHSVEVWRTDDVGTEHLVGGLYGVAVDGLFAGESMFSRPDLGGTDASKVALVHLWHHLRSRGFVLLDCQFQTPHLARLGCVEVSREDYHERLRDAKAVQPTWGDFNHATARMELA